MALPEIPRSREFLALLHDRLPEKKVRHCIGVAELLVSMVDELELDLEQALTAGLLHDLYRTWADEEMLAEARRRGLPIDPESAATPILLHGPIAADHCRQELGITNPEVLEAITWHTTGTKGLAILGQALYLADFAEVNRKYPEAAEARALLKEMGFDAALRHAVHAKAQLSKTKKTPHPHAEAFRAWVLEGRPHA